MLTHTIQYFMNHLKLKWNALWNPVLYHGWGKKNTFFEGWYYKCIDRSGENAFAIIPGIAKGWQGKNEAFIQVLDGTGCQTYYHRFEMSEFKVKDDRFEISIGNNHFTAENMILDLPELKASLKFTNHVKWPKYAGAPGIMGWYSFVPFMQCYHGILSMNHDIEGEVVYKERRLDFGGGRGYAEKDWGRSFPKCWIWMQSNHFEEDEGVSLTASIAHIPWMGNYFVGFIAGFLLDGEIYRFATYTGAKAQVTVEGDVVYMTLKDKTKKLVIEAHKRIGGELISPMSGEMIGKVEESLQSEVKIKFYDKDVLRYEGIGRHAGLEVAGDISVLLTK